MAPLAVAQTRAKAAASNAVYTAPGRVGLYVYATDIVGTITKIEFYQNGKLIKSQTGSQTYMMYTVSNLPAAFYTFYGVVYDSKGGVATSNTLSMRINPPPPTCPIQNGSGITQTDGSCKVSSCNSGYHIQANSCAANVLACSIVNGSGQQTWNGSSYGSCLVTSCNAGYKIKGNTCVVKMIVPGAGDIANQPIPSAVGGITVWSEAGAGTGITYYVSPSGNDANSGTSPSTAWKTLSKVTSTTFQAGDSVLLQGGQNFAGCMSFNSTKIKSTSAKPFTLGSYGTGRFQLTANCTGTSASAIRISGINGFILKNAIIVGNNGGAVRGVWIDNPTSVVTDGVSVKNSDISGFYAAGTAFGAEIFITGYPGAGLNHINILRNTLHGVAPASFDDNGVSGFGSSANITNILYQGNTIYNIGGRANGTNGTLGNGILANGVGSGVMQYNIGHDIGGNVNTCGGGAAFWAASSKNVIIQHNEAYHVRPIVFTKGCDWNGFDLDMDVSNSVMQYNYSHDNFGAGYLLYVSGSTWGNNVVRYNISQNDALIGSSFWGGIATNSTSSTARVDIYNNSVYNLGQGALGTSASPIAINSSTLNGVIANNIFYSAVNFGGKSQVFNTNNHPLASMKLVNNDYYGTLPLMLEWKGVRYYTLASWQAASGQDGQAMSVSPMFKTSSAGLTFQLAPDSPLLGAGLDLGRSPYNMSVGAEDYFNNDIPHSSGTGFNVGADGGTGQ